jgi:hypothetical protein
MKKLLVAAIVVLMASPAFAAIQNVKVSGDITSTYLNRQDFDLGSTLIIPEGLKNQSVFLTQTRLLVDADLSDNVSTTVGLINERAWNGEQSSNGGYTNDTNVQLYLASVTLRELLYSPLTVTVGRQVFTYGNGLVIGNGPGNQSTGNLQNIAQDLTMRTSEDGIKAVLDYKPLTIDMFYFKLAQTSQSISGLYTPTADANQSSNVYGINANYQLSDPMNTVVEAYLFSRIDGSGITASTGALNTTSDKGNTLFVPGLRASTNPIKGLNVQGEIAWQGGKVVNTSVGQEAERRSAMAIQTMASYALPVLEKYKPTVNASYTYFSGDKNGGANYNGDPTKTAKTYSAWDPFTGAMAAGTIWQSLLPLTNLNVISVGASANPLEDVTTSLTWTNLWAADSYSNYVGTTTASYNPLQEFQPNNGATPFYPVTKKGARGLGNEYDANFVYNYTEDVTFGVNLGWLVPGSALASTYNSKPASQAIADVAVKF